MQSAPPLLSPRLAALPPSVFAWLDELKRAARQRGARLLDLGIGSPDRPTPGPILEELKRALGDTRNHGYPSYGGHPRFLEAAASFLERRFGVGLDPERQLICTSGAEEAFAQLALALLADDSVTLLADVHYPIHARATLLAGGSLQLLPAASDGMLDLDAVPPDVCERARLLIVNYPHNPTATVASRAWLERALAFCREHDILLVSDLAYSELTYDGYVAPSVLELPGGAEAAVEVHSFSKSFNMAGLRLAFVAGEAAVIEALYRLRSSCTYGTPLAIQQAGAFALDHSAELTPPIAATYLARRDTLLRGFRSLGWPVVPPRATMFMWLPVPAGFTGPAWTEHLIECAGLVVTPGDAFGPGGHGWFRVSLVADTEALEEMIERLRAAGIRYQAS